ncbi:helix-turn-helix domain-containing protein [Micromonospora sp. NPDC047707]|uniref:helix-turn-helix domain-containing protein n=1 Tax=Micromonospora sp. NPDC047707 TaxID=3154498 RepID=UPI0034554232
MTGVVPPGSVLLDPADTATAAWAIREAIRALAVAGQPAPVRLLALASTLSAAAAATASAARTDPEAAAGSDADVEVVPVSEAAELLGLSESRVRQLIAGGDLPARRAGRRLLLVDRAAAAALAASRTSEGA